MTVTDPTTVNIGLDLPPATRPNWAQVMNDNLTLIDAVIGTYFSVNQLQGVWRNRTVYAVDDAVVDVVSGVVYKALVAHTSASAPTTFAEDRTANPTFWGGYASPARARGVWMQDTAYTVNDFVVSGPQYAICVQNHTSGATFAGDLALGYWSVLIDLSSIGSSTLPSLGGLGDATKFVITNPAGTGYNIYSVAEALVFLGATTVGTALLTAGSAAAGRLAIDAQQSGSYQTASAVLTTLSGFTIGAFADNLLACDTNNEVRSILSLSTLATTVPGTGVATFLANPSSGNLALALTNETGSGGGGLAVFSKSPTIDAPTLTGHVTVPTGTNGTDAVNKTQLDAATPAKLVVAANWTNVPVLTKNVNVTSVTKNGTGDFTVNFTANIDADAYFSLSYVVTPAPITVNVSIFARTKGVSSIRVISQNSGAALVDMDSYQLLMFA